jgi:hypothetical protein
MREKLIDLCKQANDELRLRSGCSTWGDFVDHLIANGVTIQKWIPVSERLPKKGEIVLACGKRHATSGMFQGASRNNPKWWHWKGNTLKEVTHWMPLPEPQKGD